MSWSVQIGRIFGIPIRLHLTFLLLMGWLAMTGMGRGDLTLLLLAAGLFACVLLHELGHSVTAQRFGIRVVDITLLPIGGLARMGSIPKDPGQELLIAVAGPAVNFVLAPVFYGAHLLLGEPSATADVWSVPGHLLEKLAALNLSIGLFNLLPAFPMDGGRILRALLAQRMPYVRATQLASSLGQLVAIGMGFAGLGLFGFPGNPMLALIALFIFIGASEEGARVQTQAVVEGVPVREAMVTQFETLRRGDTLGRAIQLLLAGTQQDFPVVDEGEVVGILTRRNLLQALATEGKDRYVSEVMEPAPAAVWPDASLEEVLERMVADGYTVVPVCSDEGLCGLLTTENATEYVLVKAALSRSQNERRRA